MTDRDEIFERLSEGGENAEQVSVRADEEAGAVTVELEELSTELDSDEARSFADDLEADARDEGWYHAGQTKPLLDSIRDAADSVD